MADDLKDTILSTIEASLDAQLRAVRRLRKGEATESKSSRKSHLSQVDMAYDVLKKARTPLHVADLLDRIQTSFGVRVDRESLVSSLAKKIAQGKRFMRTEPNTFGLRQEEHR
jgi:DNA-directed RNA polymerase delta subunit